MPWRRPGFNLETVASAVALAAQVHDGLDAFARQKRNLRRTWLSGPPDAGRDLVPVRIDRAEHVMVHEEEIEIVESLVGAPFQPVWGALIKLAAKPAIVV